MKAIKGRTGQDDTALKNARDKLVKITEEVIAGGRAIQVELELPQEKLPLVNRLRGQLDGWIEAAGQHPDQGQNQPGTAEISTAIMV